MEPNVRTFDLTQDPVQLPSEKKKDDDDMEPPEDDKLTVEKGKKRIAHLRKFQGHVIKASDNKMEDLNNIFISSRATADNVITLSVHSRGEKYRPGTRGGDEASPEKEEGKKKKKKGEKDDEEEDKEPEAMQLMNVKGLNLGLR